MSAAATRVAVVGCGVFGRNHARVYRQLQHEGVGIEFVGVVDTDSQRARSLAAEFGTQSIASIGDLRGKIDAASVAVPTSHHLSVGRELMESGSDVLVEKPLASTLEEADELMAVASKT
ncbi:MAG: gfo/Idh/MocA family oxidoreductase, partial [Acidobacteria bacterium]